MPQVDINLSVNFSYHLFTVKKESAFFDKWSRKLPDRRAAARFASRVRQLEHGHHGDVKYLADTGLGELRLDYGPGCRLYFWRRHSALILLCGGQKDTQQRDIERARDMAKELRNDRRQS